MSKPLPQKWITPLRENCPKLGPKCHYFVWPQLISSTVLTLLGMEFTRASQVATGVLFHSSMMTSRSWWMLETLRSSTFHLRMPHRSSLPSASLARQWLLSCWNTTLWPSLRREGILLCFSMSQICWLSWFPQWTVAPQCGSTHAAPDHDTPTTMLDCRQDHIVFVLSPGCRHTRLITSESLIEPFLVYIF